MSAITTDQDISTYALRLGDDALVLSHRLAEWAASAPEIEEDIALTNIGLDLLGQARNLLTLAGLREGEGRDEDALAFRRNEREFSNVQLVEQPNGDFAATIARELLFSAYQLPLYAELTGSADEDLAAIAAKAVKEVRYHRDHAAGWLLRLGDGTEESSRRMQAALDRIWPFHHELFETDELTGRLVAAGIAADPQILHRSWRDAIVPLVEQATLRIPEDGPRRPTGGRDGRHGEALGHMLAEMQWLHRSEPGARW